MNLFAASYSRLPLRLGCDKYGVDEDGGDDDAGGKDNCK